MRIFKKNKQKEKSPQEQEQENTIEKGEKEADIKEYKDPGGLSVRKMDTGLWYVEHRRTMVKVGLFLLFALGLVGWIFFLFVFGEYLITGMKKDQLIVGNLLAKNLVDHEFFVGRAAHNLIVDNVDIIPLDGNKYDLFTQVKNVNLKQWVELTYIFELDGEVIKKERSFVLPNSTSYLVALNKELPGRPDNVDFKIEDIEWRRLDPHEIPNWEEYKQDHLNIPFKDVEFTPSQSTILSEKLDINNLKFTAYNDTPYNYKKIDLLILLFSRNNVVGVNKFVVDNLASNRDREVEITWPGKFGRIGEVVIVPQINIISDDIYAEFTGQSDLMP